jgi:hypothetical protein
VVRDDPRWEPQLMTNQVWNSDTAESESRENGEWWVEIQSEMLRHGHKTLVRSSMQV